MTHETPEPTPTKRHGVLPKSTLALSIGLLIVAFVAGLVATMNVKNFSEGYDVQANKQYYLLANKEALSSTYCQPLDANGQDVSSAIEDAQPTVDGDNLSIDNIALPFASPKGVYATVTFNKDIPGARFVCDKGTNYISTFSAGTLQALRWVTMLAGGAGIAMLLIALFTQLARRDAADG